MLFSIFTLLLLGTRPPCDPVRGDLPPATFKIFVNRLEVYGDRFPNNLTNINFTYVDTDVIDYVCFNVDKKCGIRFDYFAYPPKGLVDSQAEALENIMLRMPTNSSRGARFRAKFDKSHNMSEVSCSSLCPIESITIKVKFIMIDARNVTFNFTTNDLALRGIPTKRHDVLLSHIYFYKEENVTFRCKSNNASVIMDMQHAFHSSDGQLLDLNNVRSELVFVPEDLGNSAQRIIVYFIDTTRFAETPRPVFMAAFLPVPDQIQEDINMMELNLPEENNIIDVRIYGKDELIYYQYDDGDNIDVMCSTDPKITHLKNYFLDFDGDREDYNESISKHFTLSAADHNRIVTCLLHYSKTKTNGPYQRRVRVIFVERTRPVFKTRMPLRKITQNLGRKPVTQIPIVEEEESPRSSAETISVGVVFLMFFLFAFVLACGYCLKRWGMNNQRRACEWLMRKCHCVTERLSTPSTPSTPTYPYLGALHIDDDMQQITGPSTSTAQPRTPASPSELAVEFHRDGSPTVTIRPIAPLARDELFTISGNN